MSRTRIAVVIPCFNDGVVAKDALCSLEESPEPLEVVIVDDASTEPMTKHELAILQAQGVRVVTHPENRGLAPTRMTGVAATTAPYVFPLDADDIAIPDALTRMADILDGNSDLGVCFGHYVEFGDHDVLRKVPLKLDPYRLAFTNQYPVSALFRRSHLVAAGGWQSLSPLPAGYEDWDLWMTFVDCEIPAAHAGTDVVTYRRRMHGTRMLAEAKTQHQEIHDALRARHPGIFEQLKQFRRESDLDPVRKILYPLAYGRRHRSMAELALRRTLRRLGVRGAQG